MFIELEGGGVSGMDEKEREEGKGERERKRERDLEAGGGKEKERERKREREGGERVKEGERLMSKFCPCSSGAAAR